MNFTEASLTRLTVHYTGNRQNGQSLLLSRQEQSLDKESREKISEVLLNRFRQSHERYSFHHPASLDFNEVYTYAAAMFGIADASGAVQPGPAETSSKFHELSVRIASHLYNVALHPKIKAGELYIAYFQNIRIEERSMDAIGFFKAETKSLFFDVDPTFDDINMQLKEGIELGKLDKGCLILNQDRGNGFELLIVDANGKGEEAQYWKDKFLGVLIRQNEFVQTQEFLTITKNYVTTQLPGEFEVSKTEQIDILNRSMDYFKTHGNFNKDEFEQEVLHHEDVIHSFRKFDEQYRQTHVIDQANEFEISPHAVKKQARVYKSVLKLDKNFHIYIHGDRQLIEKGYDDGLQKHYYKIYFDQET
jgi:37-kD nucleoid-associated bacterial protein